MTLARQAATTLSTALRDRARQQPHDIAYTFLPDGEAPTETLTYGRLHAEAGALAGALRQLGLTGSRAVLLYPTGAEFVRAFAACAYARVCGVPVQVPNRTRGVQLVRRIADDAGTVTVLTTAAVRDELLHRFGGLAETSGLRLLATDQMPAGADAGDPTDPEPEPDDLALLQYTSGSTGHPKGVMVSHRNMWHNAAQIAEHWPFEPAGVIVSWLPLFHDLGLMFGAVMPIRAGVPAYLMPPGAFMRRPMRWLSAVSRFRGTHTAAPNFAYQLCADAARNDTAPSTLDLSSLRAALNGAEPVRWSTVRQFSDAFAPFGFDSRAMSPGYGLAENTLKVSGSPSGAAPHALALSSGQLRENRVVLVPEIAASNGTPASTAVVSCGTTARETQVRVVSPESRRPRPAGCIGEIWVSGPCVARGYWNRPLESRATFGARIQGEEQAGPFLRTGDLGFVHDGEVYVTGRLTDVMIFQGRNHYPQDIEYTVERCHPGLRPGCAAAFSVGQDAAEKLVVLVEVDGRVRRETDGGPLPTTIRTAIRDEHGLDTADVVFVRKGTLPRTTSGKIQRRSGRRSYEDGAVRRIASDVLTEGRGA